MTRARELANFADDTAGLESVTVSDVTDLSVSASNINSATNQITDSSTDLNVDSNTLVVDKSENKVGIGTASPSSTLTVKGTLGLETTDSTNKWLAYAYTDDTLRLNYNGAGSAEVVVDNAGNVGIGTTSPSMKVNISHGDQDGLRFTCANTAETFIDFSDGDDNDVGQISYDHADNHMAFTTNAAEKMRIDSSGNIGLGTTSPAAELHINDTGGLSRIRLTGTAANADDFEFGQGTTGVANGGFEIYDVNESATRFVINSSGTILIGKGTTSFSTAGIELLANGNSNFTRDDGNVININRTTSNGSLIGFYQDGTEEGNISVSGTNVSYNGFTGTHESSGIAVDTAIGTVCSTIDELDTYVSGNKEGQERTDHAKIKVSDTVGDARVYGVLFSYSETDNKPIVASVGIGSVLVTGACEGGDLLESNGDGTAKVQDDDIIRSKTIGKVTIGNLDTNVKLVSCVLYCG